MRNPGVALASFFTACANALLKGGIKTPAQRGAVEMFLQAAQKSLGK